MATMFYHVFTNPEFRAAAQFEHEIKEHAICKSDVRLDGKVALVTGGTSGIGKECVREFVRRGAKVILPCRYRPKGKAAKEEIENDTGKFGQVILMDLDLSSMKSVRKFADQFNKQESRLDILINNGGIMKALNTHTSEGFETIIATNYLGHFLLTHLLMDLLKKSAPSRIINVSSSAHFSGTDMMFKDFHIKSGCFGPSNFYLYCRSKAANVMHARQLQELYGNLGVTAYSCHPGTVHTEITRYYTFLNDFSSYILFKTLDCWNPMVQIGKTPKQGSQTPLYCSLQRGLESKAGRYFVECEEYEMSKLCNDDKACKVLWDFTKKELGIE